MSGVVVDPAARIVPRAPWPVWLMMVSLAFTFFVDVGGVMLSPLRVLFLVLVPILGIRLLMGRYGKVTLIDWMVFFYLFWTIVSTAMRSPWLMGTFIGMNTLTALGGYLIARAYIRTPEAFLGFVRISAILVLISLPFAIQETRTGESPLIDFFERTPFLSANEKLYIDTRFGLERVQFTFAHSILYGVWASVTFSLIFVSMRKLYGKIVRTIWCGLIGLATFLALSSGPFLSLLVQVYLTAYGLHARRLLPHPWRVFMIGFVIVYFFAEIFSTRPAYFAIVSRLTFNVGTTYARQMILDAGLAVIRRDPIFGLGPGKPLPGLPFFLQNTLDNHWLLVASVYGMPAFIALFGAYVLTLIRAGRRPFAQDGMLWSMRLGWAMSMVGLGLGLATVAVWNEMIAIIFILMGSGAWFATASEGVARAAAPEPVRTLRHTRFGAGAEGVMARARPLKEAPGGPPEEMPGAPAEGPRGPVYRRTLGPKPARRAPAARTREGNGPDLRRGRGAGVRLRRD